MTIPRQILNAIWAVLLIVVISGCKPSIDDKDPSVRRLAVKQITDQTILAKLAISDDDYSVREDALAKVDDQVLLARVGTEAADYGIREKATSKLTNQTVLARIALHDIIGDVRRSAIDRLVSSAALAKTTDGNDDRQLEAIGKLMRAACGSDLQEHSERSPVRSRSPHKGLTIICDVVASDMGVPVEHRNRLMAAILPALGFLLNYPDVVEEFGEIVSIAVRWESRSASYQGSSWGTMPGEFFECTVNLSKLTKPLSHSWSTNFPSSTPDLKFQAASVNCADLMLPVLNRLPQTVLAKIAQDTIEWHICGAVVDKLTDRALLEDLSKKGDDNSLRDFARRRLAHL